MMSVLLHLIAIWILLDALVVALLERATRLSFQTRMLPPAVTPSIPPLPHRVPHPQQGHNGEAHAEPNRDDECV